ncbi:hypothetical protein [Streptomyces hyaluromycini]|uniref:hypothetical protein n=1 Tax=Streptomyces hyaluromycini TaxID=1377993 RepID=UPI0011AEA325|nr:hypothetical protein [Streptomyces hyaluromycini]
MAHQTEGQREKGEGPPPTYTPWLVVRATPSDKGARPAKLGTVFYASPDIGAAPADPWGRVRPEEEVTVSVTVQNLGFATAAGVRATFWWAEATGGIVPSNAKRIGTSPRVSIAAGQAETLICGDPWTPHYIAGSHECLVVEVSCLSDPLQQSFRPDLDRHVGQRNMTILEPEGHPHSSMLILTNPFSEEVTTTLHLRSFAVQSAERLLGFGLHVRPVDALVHAGDRTLTDAFAALGLEVGDVETGTGLQVGEPDVKEGEAYGFSEETQRQIRLRGHAQHDFGPEVARIILPPAAVAQVEVTTDLGGLNGRALIHRLTQVADGVDVGGYALLSLP